MPKFDVSITQSVEIYGSVEVSAKDEDTAREKVQALIDEGVIQEMTWDVPGSPRKSAEIDWENQDGVTIQIDEVNEL
jgi:hypothetical protein